MKRLKSNLMYSGLSMMLLLGTATLFTGQAHAQFSSPVHDVNNPDLQPVAASAPLPITLNGGRGSTTLITVPAGKRLVVDFVAGFSEDGALPKFAFIDVQGTNTAIRVSLPIPIQQAPEGKAGIFAQPIKLYAEPGESIVVFIFDDANRTWSANLVGHFVNVQ